MDAAEKALADEAALADETGGTSTSQSAQQASQGSQAAQGSAQNSGTTQANQAPGGRPTAGNAATALGQTLNQEALVVELNSNASPAVTVEGKWLTTLKQPGTPGTPSDPATPAPPDAAPPPQTTGRTTEPPQAGAPQTGASLPLGGATPGAAHVPNDPHAPAGPVSTGTTLPGETVDPPVTNQGAADAPASPAKLVPSGQPDAQAPPPSVDDQPIVQMMVMLKRSGVGFNDAVQVLRNLQTEGPMPPKHMLKALWNTTDVSAPEEEQPLPAIVDAPLDDIIRDASWHKTQAAAEPGAQAAPPAAQTQAPPARAEQTQAAPAQAEQTQQGQVQYTEIEQAPVRQPLEVRGDAFAARPDLAGSAQSGPTGHPASPTLQTVIVDVPANQAYISSLSTAEFQRLVTVLGANAPSWFWDVRGHTGIRGLFEQPGFARLNSMRVIGVRPLFWILGLIGLIVFWLVGARWGTWW